MVKRDLWKQLLLLILLVLGLIGLRVWFFEPISITQSMSNQYLREDDMVIVLRNAEVDYGDFILYQHDGENYISRVIALAGESVTYMDDVLYRNNQIIDEVYLHSVPEVEYYTEDFTIATLTGGQYQTIPEGHLLVLNDIRTNRDDSRHFGLIAEKEIVGRLTFRVSPLSDFGFIETGLVP